MTLNTCSKVKNTRVWCINYSVFQPSRVMSVMLHYFLFNTWNILYVFKLKCLIFLQCTNTVSVHKDGLLQRLFIHHCIRNNARKLNTWCSVTAHTHVASFRSVHHCSSPGALQAKLLVQSFKKNSTQIPHFTPRSYKLHTPPPGFSTAASMWIKV